MAASNPSTTLDAQPTAPMCVPINEAARLLSIGRTSVYELLKTGELRSRKVGNRTLVTMASIREFVGEDA